MIERDVDPLRQGGVDTPTNAPPRVKRRKGWLAFVLGLFVPGLGQLYAGYPGRALMMYALPVLALPVAVAVLSLHSLGPLNLLGSLALALVARLVPLFDGLLAARRQAPDYTLRRFNRWYVYAACGLVHIGLTLSVKVPAVSLARISVQAFRLPAGSMEPTLLIGDHLLVDNLAYGVRLPWAEAESWHLADPRRGDLVTLRLPLDRSRVFIKRVIGLPGERVEVRDKLVLIDGRPLQEPYAHHLAGRSRPASSSDLDDTRPTWGPATVPTGRYFVLGDNRDNSLDSRYFGYVPSRDILGRVRLVYWSIAMSRADVSGDGPLLHPVRWRRVGLRLD